MMTSKTFRYSVISCSLLLTFSSLCHAVVISDEVFVKNGGNFNDVKGTIKKAYEPLVKKSFSYPFQVVGNIAAGGLCTASWIGEDEKNTYILTAAHCVENSKDLLFPWNGKFYDRNGQLLAKGGLVHINPYRLNPPAGHGGASTDIAIIVADKVKPMLDDRNQPAQQPWLYDGTNELNHTVNFVGYGVWGVRKTGTHGDQQPSFNKRRGWGQSFIDGIWEADHGMGAPFRPENNALGWARTGSGDSGSSWWQQQQGFWTIIATTNGGNNDKSTGARVSKYIPWIKSIYPNAATLKDKTTITATSSVVLPDFSRELDLGSVAYVVPYQEGVEGPDALINKSESGISKISVALMHQGDKQKYNVVFRAWRETGCQKTAMNNAFTCEDGSSALTIRYYDEDNAQLPAGRYTGEVNLQARGWEEHTYSNALTLQADIEKLTPSVLVPLVEVNKPGISVVGTNDVGFGYKVTGNSNQNNLNWKWERIEGNSLIYLKSYDKATAEVVVPRNLFDASAKFRLTATNSDNKTGEAFVTVNVARPAVSISGPASMTSTSPAKLQAKANFDQDTFKWTLKQGNQIITNGIDQNGQIKSGLPAGNYIAEVTASSVKGARTATKTQSVQVIAQAQNTDQAFINNLNLSMSSVDNGGSVTFSGILTSSSKATSNPAYQWTLPSGAQSGNTSKLNFTVNKTSQVQNLKVKVKVTAGQASGDRETNIIVPALPDAGQYPLYQPGTPYTAGQIVKNRNGELYQCRPIPFAAWCGSTSAFHYEPGVGHHWTEAWTKYK